MRVDLPAGRPARRRAADLRRGAARLPRGPAGRVAGQGADQPGPSAGTGAPPGIDTRRRHALRTRRAHRRRTAGRRCTPARCSPRTSTSTPRAEPPDHFYGRAGNPTWTALEAAIGALDGGECVTFASGMAASARCCGSAPGPAARSSCRPTATTSPGPSPTPSSPRSASRSARCPPPARGPTALLDGATLLLDRDPVQPRPRCPRHPRDRRAPSTPPARCWPSTTPPPPRSASALSSSAPTSPSPPTPRRSPGTATCCSATSAPPTPRWPSASATARTRSGAIPGPMEAWLAHRGLATFDLRLARQAANAHALAACPARPPRRDRRPLARPARRPGPRRRHRRRCGGGTASCASRCPRSRLLPGSWPPRTTRLGHQLRRAPQHRGPARALGRRRPARSGPVLRRLRRHRRPRRRRRAALRPVSVQPISS